MTQPTPPQPPPQPSPPPPQTPQLQTEDQLVQRAWELKKAGLTDNQIAHALKVGKRTARLLVAQAAYELSDPLSLEIDHQTILELSRLDSALIALAPKVRHGDLQAIDRWLKLSESRRKLLGLNRPPAKLPPPPAGPEKLYDTVNTEIV